MERLGARALRGRAAQRF